MDKRIFLCAAALLAMCDATASDFDKALLWKITGNGLRKPSYLFGTWHGAGVNNMDNAAFLASYPDFLKAFGDVETVMAEINFENDDLRQASPEHRAGMRMATSLPESVTYQAMLSSEDFYLLDSLTRRFLGTDASKLRTKPSYVMISLAGLIEAELNPADTASNYGQKTMDLYIWHKAREEGKRLGGLETIEDQSSALLPIWEIPLDKQFEMLEGCLESIGKGEMMDDESNEIIKKVADAYKDYDIETVDNILVGISRKHYSKEFNDRFDKVLVQDRNEAWIPVIEQTVKHGPALVTVGARHLPRDYGLIKLLRAKGYTVEPVN